MCTAFQCAAVQQQVCVVMTCLWVCVTVISTASTHMHVSCLNFDLPMNPLSLITQRNGRPSSGGLITCYSSPVLLVSDWGRERVLPLTLPLSASRRPLFEGCPWLIRPPHSASTAVFISRVQVRLEETLHEGEINRQEKSIWAASMGSHTSTTQVYSAQDLTTLCVVFRIMSGLVISGFDQESVT